MSILSKTNNSLSLDFSGEKQQPKKEEEKAQNEEIASVESNFPFKNENLSLFKQRNKQHKIGVSDLKPLDNSPDEETEK